MAYSEDDDIITAEAMDQLVAMGDADALMIQSFEKDLEDTFQEFKRSTGAGASGGSKSGKGSGFGGKGFRKGLDKLYRHRPQIALQEKWDTMARAGDKLGRHLTQSRGKDGKGKQDLNHLVTASASKAGKKMTRRQRQPRAKS